MSSRFLTDARPSINRHRQVVGFSPSKIAFIVVSLVIVVIDYVISPERFYDFDTYLYITDSLYYFPESDWISFEVGSTALLVGLRYLTGNTIIAMTMAHFLLGIIFLLFLWILIRRNMASWQAIAFCFAMYGPLLAFVTIRATPAYLLVALAAIYATEARTRSLVLLTLSFMFHVSTALAAVPTAFAWLQSRFKVLAVTDRALGIAVVAITLYAIVFLLFRNYLSNFVSEIVAVVPFLNKYEILTSGLDPTSVSRLESNSNYVKHYIYLACASSFTILFLFMRDEQCRRFRGYLLISFFIFLFSQFSPIVAYRQSIYWMLPAIFLFPWGKFVSGLFRSVSFVILCAGIFYVNLGGVYS